MVRVHCTLKSNKTNSSNKNRVPTSNSEKTVDSPGTNDKLCDFPTYSKCDISITRDVIALQCDKCISVNSWKCVDCFDLPVAAYETLMSGCGSESLLKMFYRIPIEKSLIEFYRESYRTLGPLSYRTIL